MGATRLEALIASTIASYGKECWRTDAALQQSFSHPNGRAYHRESIGRARRALARYGWIESQRVHCGGLLPSGKTSTHGTTVKRIAWASISLRRVHDRGEVRRLDRPRFGVPPTPAPIVACEPVAPAPAEPFDPSLAFEALQAYEQVLVELEPERPSTPNETGPPE